MKNLLNVPVKNISVKKYIRPLHNQQYYNNKFTSNHKERERYLNSRPTQNIFPGENHYPDDKSSSVIKDEENDHFMHYLFKRKREFEQRAEGQIKLARNIYEVKQKQRTLSDVNVSNDEISIDSVNFGGNIEPLTNLQFGMGFDDFLKKRMKLRAQEQSQIGTEDRSLNELVNKLGYLDLRDFLAINKYILEAEKHDDYVNKAKANFLKLALSRLSKKKKEEMTKQLKRIDELNEKEDAKSKENRKIEYLFENLAESKELFYRFYYKIKELNEKERNVALDQFEKYNKMVEALNNKKTRVHDLDFLDAEMGNPKDLMERIINQYREERTLEIKLDAKTISDKITKIKDHVTSEGMSYLTYEPVYLLCKFYSFFNKYKKVYHPTNMETERLINRYLREKRLKEFTREKMMQMEDPYFSEEDKEISSIVDEETKQKAMERNKMKKKYFDAKYNYLKDKLEKEIDKQLADELGYVITNKANSPENKEDLSVNEILFGYLPNVQFDWIHKAVDDHFKSFKLEYMYNYLDFYSNKYKVRKAIASDLKRKVSLSEINFVLNNLVIRKEGAPNRKNPLNICDIIGNEFGVIKPDFVEKATNSGHIELDMARQSSIETAIKLEDNKDIKLSQQEQFEVELYKGFKNDPFYKHYLRTHLAFFSETMSDIHSTLPHSMRGFKIKDKLRWEVLGKVQDKLINAAPTTETDKNELIDSISRNEVTAEANKEPRSAKSDKIQYFYGHGKRKRCNAYCRLISPGEGKITINGRSIEKYFPYAPNRGKITLPLSATDTLCTVDLVLKIQGGGWSGQADAAVPAISKALVKMNPDWEDILAKNYLLKHDPRNVESKRPGRIKARKGYVYRRR